MSKILVLLSLLMLSSCQNTVRVKSKYDDKRIPVENAQYMMASVGAQENNRKVMAAPANEILDLHEDNVKPALKSKSQSKTAPKKISDDVFDDYDEDEDFGYYEDDDDDVVKKPKAKPKKHSYMASSKNAKKTPMKAKKVKPAKRAPAFISAPVEDRAQDEPKPSSKNDKGFVPIANVPKATGNPEEVAQMMQKKNDEIAQLQKKSDALSNDINTKATPPQQQVVVTPTAPSAPVTAQAANTITPAAATPPADKMTQAQIQAKLDELQQKIDKSNQETVAKKDNTTTITPANKADVKSKDSGPEFQTPPEIP